MLATLIVMPPDPRRREALNRAADGVFLPILRDHGTRGLTELESDLLDAVHDLYGEDVLNSDAWREGEVAWKSIASGLPAQWLESAQARQFVHKECRDSGSSENGAPARFRLTATGRETLETTERNWRLLRQRETPKRSRSWLDAALLLAIIGGCVTTLVVAANLLHGSILAWLGLAIVGVALSSVFLARLAVIRRTRRERFFYWLYLGHRGPFYRSLKAADFFRVYYEASLGGGAAK